MSSSSHKLSCEEFVLTLKARNRFPIVISVPHDGFPPHDLFGFFEERKEGEKGLDSNVWPVVKDILRITNKVSAVRGLFPRGLIDYNRPLAIYRKERETALIDPRLRHYYNHYHGTIAKLLKTAIGNYGRKECLLMDFHGFVEQPPEGEFDIILSSGKRNEVEEALNKFLSEKKKGYRVLSALTGNEYGAGFTTLYYAEKFRINTIQIEIAKRFRTLKGREDGQKLSLDMAEFLILNFDLR